MRPGRIGGMDEGGESACWLDRVCPECGRLRERPDPVPREPGPDPCEPGPEPCQPGPEPCENCGAGAAEAPGHTAPGS